MSNSEKQNQMANAIRFLAADAIERAKSGHPGLPLGAADIATVLFRDILNYDPHKPKWPNRDRFVLSAGHGSMLLYAVLYLTGYEEMSLEQIQNFRQLGAKTAGHPEYGYSGGIETTTGPLGQGLANAVGMAIAERLMNARFPELISHYVYALVGDGCLMEGISQEAISFAGHLQLNKLIILWDDNNITIDGAVSLSDSTDQAARFKACGWNVIAVDGHAQDEIFAAIKTAQQSDRPTLIACRTKIGYGAPTKAGTPKVHGSALGSEELAAMRQALNWPYEAFSVPETVLDAWRLAGLNAAKKRLEWEKQLQSLAIEKRSEFERLMRGDLPGSWPGMLLDYKKELVLRQKPLATRKASELILDLLVKHIPELIGGSADLTGSNNTKTPDLDAISKQDFCARYLHYGIREHGMAAIMNGLALSAGFIPYGGTFLCFSDYMRPAMRLSSLMKQRVIYILTHDSIGLGEDGPTHQPVEHLASLRAMPNHLVMRPADAVETLECWQLALENKERPTSLILSRQDLAPVRKEYDQDNLCALGAYELVTADGEALITLFASGSEVEIALKAHERLVAAGIATRIVSVPCFELFFEQSLSYRQALIGASPVKIAIEAALAMGWEQFIGEKGCFIGMRGFGESAPAAQLYQHFAITADNVVEKALEKLKEQELIAPDFAF